jgi:hypothetical protein
MGKAIPNGGLNTRTKKNPRAKIIAKRLSAFGGNRHLLIDASNG